MTQNGLLLALKIEDQILKCKYLEIMNNLTLSFETFITVCRKMIISWKPFLYKNKNLLVLCIRHALNIKYLLNCHQTTARTAGKCLLRHFSNFFIHLHFIFELKVRSSVFKYKLNYWTEKIENQIQFRSFQRLLIGKKSYFVEKKISKT